MITDTLCILSDGASLLWRNGSKICGFICGFNFCRCHMLFTACRLFSMEIGRLCIFHLRSTYKKRCGDIVYHVAIYAYTNLPLTYSSGYFFSALVTILCACELLVFVAAIFPIIINLGIKPIIQAKRTLFIARKFINNSLIFWDTNWLKPCGHQSKSAVSWLTHG